MMSKTASVLSTMVSLLSLVAPSLGQKPADTASQPIPDIRTLMIEVMNHQKELEKVRENYTFHSTRTTQDIDGSGQTKKTESEDSEVFYIHTHRIERTVKKDGKPLNDHDQQKEQERINKLLEKAQKVPPGEPLEGPNEHISVTHLLEIMQVS